MLNNLNFDFYNISYLTRYTPNISFLSFPFYLETIGYLCVNEGYYLEQEGMEHYFFGLTLSGSGILQFRENRYVLSANQAFLINRNDYFRMSTSKGEKWNLKWFYFGGTACKEYFQLINEKSFQTVTLTVTVETSNLIDKLYNITQSNDPLADIEISMLITKILTGVIKNKHLNINITGDKSEILKKSLDFILNNYSDSIKINDICDAVFTSKSHLINLFKAYLHTTPHKYITKLRIDKSKKLLLETQTSLDEISQQSGFESTSLFIDNFKKYTDTTPNKYRKTAMFP